MHPPAAARLTSTSIESRSRTAFAYSVRLSRCSAGAFSAGAGRRAWSRRASSSAAKPSSTPRSGRRRAAWRHHARSRSFRTTFSSVVGVAPRRDRSLSVSSARPADLRAIVVTGDAVPLETARDGRRAPRPLAHGRGGRRRASCAAGVAVASGRTGREGRAAVPCPLIDASTAAQMSAAGSPVTTSLLATCSLFHRAT